MLSDWSITCLSIQYILYTKTADLLRFVARVKKNVGKFDEKFLFPGWLVGVITNPPKETKNFFEYVYNLLG